MRRSERCLAINSGEFTAGFEGFVPFRHRRLSSIVQYRMRASRIVLAAIAGLCAGAADTFAQVTPRPSIAIARAAAAPRVEAYASGEPGSALEAGPGGTGSRHREPK